MNDGKVRIVRARCLLLVAFALAAATGCGESLKAGQTNSPTTGVAIEILRTDRASSHALYRVEPEGSISFGGGFDALQGRTMWTGVLTPEQIESLQTLLREHGWFAGPPAADSTVPNVATASDQVFHYTVRFASPERSWKTAIRGGGADLAPIVGFLQETCLARHEELLQSFPEPNEPPVSDQ